MAKAISKVDLVNPYRTARKIEVPLTEAERKAARKKDPKTEPPPKIVLEPYYYARVGSELEIITDISFWIKDVLAVQNKDGERFSMRSEHLDIKK